MSQKNGPAIPDEVEKEIEESISEDSLIGGYLAGKGNENEKLPIVESWFPEAEEWHGKTRVTPRQAQAVAIAKHLPIIFDEIDEYDKFIENMIDDYLKLLTSVEGVSRDQQMQVLQSLFGGVSDEENEAKSFMKAAISAGESENNE